MPTQPSKSVSTFPNPHPDRDYTIRLVSEEFTSVCPKTGQPDFGTIEIEYVPDQACVEMKSLKLYLWSYRNEGVFYEDVTNRILNDLVSACHPRWMRVAGIFKIRGGIQNTVTATHGQRA
ncbi:MAG: preQ(1) synthase [Planctomycetota bacterium]|nr:preQ(1) synthase [Planctomycetota bacterium]